MKKWQRKKSKKKKKHRHCDVLKIRLVDMNKVKKLCSTSLRSFALCLISLSWLTHSPYSPITTLNKDLLIYSFV